MPTAHPAVDEASGAHPSKQDGQTLSADHGQAGFAEHVACLHRPGKVCTRASFTLTPSRNCFRMERNLRGKQPHSLLITLQGTCNTSPTYRHQNEAAVARRLEHQNPSSCTFSFVRCFPSCRQWNSHTNGLRPVDTNLDYTHFSIHTCHLFKLTLTSISTQMRAT